MLSQLHFPSERVSGNPTARVSPQKSALPSLPEVINADRWSTNTKLQHNQSVTYIFVTNISTTNAIRNTKVCKCTEERINLKILTGKESRVQRFILIHSDQASTMIRVRARGGRQPRRGGSTWCRNRLRRRRQSGGLAGWRDLEGRLLPKKAIRATATRTHAKLPPSPRRARSLACW